MRRRSCKELLEVHTHILRWLLHASFLLRIRSLFNKGSRKHPSACSHISAYLKG